MVARRSDAGVSRISVLFTLVAVLIVSSIVSLVLVTTGDDPADRNDAGGAAAAAAPTTSAAPTSAAPSTTAPQPSTAPEPSTSPVARNSEVAPTGETPAVRKPITYTVKSGDNLTVIAAWFKLRGYGDLYAANRSVIGADPNLIQPGQRITVSSDGMSVSR